VADYLGLLRELAAFDSPYFAFGSIAEAALLDGGLRRDHGDLDVVIPRGELEERLAQLHGLGFAPFTAYYEPRPGLPLVYGSTRGDLAVELSLLDHDAHGRPYCVLGAGDGPVAVFLPQDSFEWPSTIVAGVPIHTLSPLALVHIGAAVTTTLAFGPARPKNIARQARLIDAFFPDADPAALEPRIMTIT